MKRLLVLVLAALAATACGGDADPAAPTDAPPDVATSAPADGGEGTSEPSMTEPVGGVPTTGDPGELMFTLVDREGEDVVSGGPAVEPDGAPDAHFKVTGIGPPVEALILTHCDETGHGASHWDTVAGEAPLPPGFQYEAGDATYVLGVRSFGAGLNEEDGTFRASGLTDVTTLDLFVADDGAIAGGLGSACLTIVRPGGELTTVATPLS